MTYDTLSMSNSVDITSRVETSGKISASTIDGQFIRILYCTVHPAVSSLTKSHRGPRSHSEPGTASIRPCLVAGFYNSNEVDRNNVHTVGQASGVFSVAATTDHPWYWSASLGQS